MPTLKQLLDPNKVDDVKKLPCNKDTVNDMLVPTCLRATLQLKDCTLTKDTINVLLNKHYTLPSSEAMGNGDIIQAIVLSYGNHRPIITVTGKDYLFVESGPTKRYQTKSTHHVLFFVTDGAGSWYC